MLLVYPFIIVCFSFINIYCDVRISNLEKRDEGVFISRSIRDIQISNTTNQEDLIVMGNLETSTQNSDRFGINKNITRVRKQKRRRRPASLKKEITAEQNSTKGIAENILKDMMETSDKMIKKDIIIEKNTSKNKDSGEKKENGPTNEKVFKVESEQVLPKIKHEIAEEKAIIEKSNNNKTSGPRTFPKRPAEFNPVFKKRSRERDPVVKIINEKNYVYGHNGNFHYSFEGGDGTKVYSRGNLISSKNEKAGESVEGAFSYKDGEGNDYSLTYTADENGYQPVGAHLPTPPPIPPAIARALKYLATKSTPAPVTEEYSL